MGKCMENKSCCMNCAHMSIKVIDDFSVSCYSYICKRGF